MPNIRIFITVTVLGWCLISTLFIFFGEKLELGSLQNWVSVPERLAIIIGFGAVVGGISTIASFLFKLKARPSLRALAILILLTQMTTIQLLPVWAYARDFIFSTREPQCSADDFIAKKPALFICLDCGFPNFLCATVEPEDKKYVRLTNELYRLAFIQHCVDDSFTFLVTIPLLIFLIAFLRKGS